MVALITGGSSGMGLEFARGLASRGCELVLVSNREEELASASAALSAEFPVKVRTRFQDLAKPLAADELYEWRCAREWRYLCSSSHHRTLGTAHLLCGRPRRKSDRDWFVC